MRLITLGDSGAAGFESWTKKLSVKLNCELINFAKPASQILLQIQLLQDWLIDNEIYNDDIIIWQIGWSYHPVTHISYEELPKVKKADRFIEKRLSIPHYLLRDNKIDNNKRISLLPISPVLHKFSNRKKEIDKAEVLHQFLFMLVILKKICSRILIIHGQNEFLEEEHWTRLKDHLVAKDIDFVEEGMYNWCVRNNLETQFFHPTNESYGTYTENVLVPKLKDLGWI